MIISVLTGDDYQCVDYQFSGELPASGEKGLRAVRFWRRGGLTRLGTNLSLKRPSAPGGPQGASRAELTYLVIMRSRFAITAADAFDLGSGRSPQRWRSFFDRLNFT